MSPDAKEEAHGNIDKANDKETHKAWPSLIYSNLYYIVSLFIFNLFNDNDKMTHKAWPSLKVSDSCRLFSFS